MAQAKSELTSMWLHTVAKYTHQLVLGLDVLFKLKYCHMDIKPDNILVNDKGELVLADFGVATKFGESLPNMGNTLYYYRSRKTKILAQASVDLFAVGVLLFELLSGVHPFAEKPKNFASRFEPIKRKINFPLLGKDWVDESNMSFTHEDLQNLFDNRCPRVLKEIVLHTVVPSLNASSWDAGIIDAILSLYLVHAL